MCRRNEEKTGRQKEGGTLNWDRRQIKLSGYGDIAGDGTLTYARCCVRCGTRGSEITAKTAVGMWHSCSRGVEHSINVNSTRALAISCSVCSDQEGKNESVHSFIRLPAVFPESLCIPAILVMTLCLFFVTFLQVSPRGLPHELPNDASHGHQLPP